MTVSTTRIHRTAKLLFVGTYYLYAKIISINNRYDYKRTVAGKKNVYV